MYQQSCSLREAGINEDGGMRIGELSNNTGVSVRSLRYYEQQDLLQPQRTSAGHRFYSPQDEPLVRQIQDLFEAGFCSSVIRKLLPALSNPVGNREMLQTALAAAQARLESEKESIAAELRKLKRLGAQYGLEPDAHVTLQNEEHDSSTTAQATAFDHRNRRLR
ncbi:MerR family transcriptional regulator [Paenarthrobacter sp. NPDC090517]|uniref:MerR family transcriptional regulator n=1 Tax=Paenarthrobacter sp. NPDC090517 TaxID=3364381 RepID=UPI00381F3B6B